ncbi:MAG: hypothetical protein NC820_02275 [Candidatus Omnitrophica bacterium]|nr:hypothetical protein [Candidatus Omnitrophota bacterium]
MGDVARILFPKYYADEGEGALDRGRRWGGYISNKYKELRRVIRELGGVSKVFKQIAHRNEELKNRFIELAAQIMAIMQGNTDEQDYENEMEFYRYWAEKIFNKGADKNEIIGKLAYKQYEIREEKGESWGTADGDWLYAEAIYNAVAYLLQAFKASKEGNEEEANDYLKNFIADILWLAGERKEDKEKYNESADKILNLKDKERSDFLDNILPKNVPVSQAVEYLKKMKDTKESLSYIAKINLIKDIYIKMSILTGSVLYHLRMRLLTQEGLINDNNTNARRLFENVEFIFPDGTRVKLDVELPQEEINSLISQIVRRVVEGGGFKWSVENLKSALKKKLEEKGVSLSDGGVEKAAKELLEKAAKELLKGNKQEAVNIIEELIKNLQGGDNKLDVTEVVNEVDPYSRIDFVGKLSSHARDIFAHIVGGHFKRREDAEEEKSKLESELKEEQNKEKKDLISAQIDFQQAIIDYENAWLRGENNKELKPLIRLIKNKAIEVVKSKYALEEKNYQGALPIKETLRAERDIRIEYIRENFDGAIPSETAAMNWYLTKKVSLKELGNAQREAENNGSQQKIRVKIGLNRYAYIPVEIINSTVDVKVGEAIERESVENLENAWNAWNTPKKRKIVKIGGIVIDDKHPKWKEFVKKTLLLKKAFTILTKEDISSLKVVCKNESLILSAKEGSELEKLLNRYDDYDNNNKQLTPEEIEKATIVNLLIKEFGEYKPVEVDVNNKLQELIEKAKSKGVDLEGIYLGKNNNVDLNNINENDGEIIKFKEQIIARIVRESILSGLEQDDPTTAAMKILARALKEGFEFIRKEFENEKEENEKENEENKVFDTKKASEQLQMVLGLLSEQSIALEASGGKTLGGAMEYIVWSLLNPKVNMVWVVKTDEVSGLVNPPGEKGKIVRPLLARFGLELVSADEEMLDLRNSDSNSSGLKEALSNPNKIVVFSQTQFGHIRNINDPDLLATLIGQDIVRIDELHIPFSDRVTYIIGGGHKHITKALAEVGLSREQVEKAYDWVAALREGSDKKSVEESEEPMVYHGLDGKFGLNEVAMQDIHNKNLNPTAVYACLEARFSDGNRYEFVDGVPKPKDRGKVQIDKEISDPVYFTALLIKEERENEKRKEQDKVEINWDKIYVTETTHQATLAEVLRFSPFTSVLGYSGTLAGVEMLHRLHLGKGVFIISETIFNAQVLSVESKDRIDKVVELVRAHKGYKGMLIFCYNEELLKELRDKLGKEFGMDEIKIIDGQTPEISNDDNVWDINRLQKKENEKTIILSNVRGATGYSYEGERDLLIVDGENWTYSDLLQAIYRNNRQGEQGERIVLCDKNNFIQNEGKLPEEVKKKIENELERPLLSQGEKTRKNIIDETVSSYKSEDKDLSNLLTNAHYRDIINISEALLHNSREALHSLIIESIKSMLRRAEEINGDKNKEEREKSEESKFLEEKLHQAIRNRYRVTDSDLALSPYSLEGEDVLRQNIRGVLQQAEKIFDEIARNKDVSNLSRLEAKRLRDSARRAINNYDSLKKETIQESMCFQKARSFEDIVMTARSFEDRILPEAVRVPGDVSRNPKIAKVLHKLNPENDEKFFDKYEGGKPSFYQDIHHRMLRGDEILTLIAQILESNPSTGPPLLVKLILDLDNESNKFRGNLENEHKNTPLSALPPDKKLTYIKSVYQYIKEVYNQEDLTNDQKKEPAKEVYNQEDLTNDQKKELADILTFLAIPQITPLSNYTDFKSLALAVSMGEIYCALLSKVQQENAYGWTRKELLDELMSNPGYVTLHLELSRRRIPLISPNWWARRNYEKQKPVLDEVTSFILDYPLKGNRDVRRLSRFIRKYEDYRGNKLPRKLDEAKKILSKLLGRERIDIDEDALRFTFAYLSYTHPTKLSNWKRISEAKKLVELFEKLNIGNFDPDEFYRLAGFPEFGEVKEAWDWINKPQKLKTEKFVSKRTKFKEVLEMVSNNNFAEFLYNRVNRRERKTDSANPVVMGKIIPLMIVNFLINFVANHFGLINLFSSALSIHQFFARILLFMVIGVLFGVVKWLANKFAQLPLRKEKKILNEMHKAIERKNEQGEPQDEKEQGQLTLESAKEIAGKIVHKNNEEKYSQVLGMILWFSSLHHRTVKIDVEEVAIIGNDGKVNIEAVKALVGKLQNLSQGIQKAIGLLPEEDKKKYEGYTSLSFLVDPRNQKNIEDLKEEAKKAKARKALNEVLAIPNEDPEEIPNEDPKEGIRSSLDSLQKTGPNIWEERAGKLISQNEEAMKFLFGEENTQDKICEFLRMYAEKLATKISKAIDKAEEHFGFKENEGIATGVTLTGINRGDEIRKDFYYTIRTILEDSNKTPEEKVKAIEALTHTTERDLRVHLIGKDKLKELLGQKFNNILSGFSFEGITIQFTESILSKIKDKNIKNKVKKELENMLTKLVSMVKRWAEASVEREGKVSYWQREEDTDVIDVFTKTFEQIKTLITELKAIKRQKEDYSSVIEEIRKVINDLENNKSNNPNRNFRVGLKEAQGVIDNLLNKNNPKTLGEAKEEIIELLKAYKNLLIAWNNKNKTTKKGEKIHKRREDIDVMIAQLNNNNWDENKKVTDRIIKARKYITLKRILQGLKEAIEAENKPALVCRQSILEVAQKVSAQKVAKPIQEKVDEINKEIDKAEDIVRIRNSGSQRELTDNDYDIERKLAEYEYYRRRLLFLYNVPKVLKEVGDGNGNVSLQGLQRLVKAVFKNLDDNFVINETEENLNKFLYLLRLGEKGKIRFSEIGEEVWRMNFAALKGKYDIHEEEDVEFNDENAHSLQGELVLDRYIDKLREYKDELSRLNLNKKNNKLEINKAKEFLEEKGLSELSKYLLPKSEGEKNVIIGKLDDLINNLDTNKTGALPYVIESLAITFNIKRREIAQCIIGLILEGKYELNLIRIIKKLNRSVYLYMADADKIQEYFNSENEPLLIMSKEGKIITVLGAFLFPNNNNTLSTYWLVLNEKGEAAQVEPIRDEFSIYSPVRFSKSEKKKFGKPVYVFKEGREKRAWFRAKRGAVEVRIPFTNIYFGIHWSFALLGILLFTKWQILTIILAFVLFHEVCHSLTAKGFGFPTDSIRLALGAVANIGRNKEGRSWENSKQEFWIALAGPMSNFLLARLFFALGLSNFAWINLVLGLFNFFLPFSPADGSRLLKGLIARVKMRKVNEQIAFEKANNIVDKFSKVFGKLLFIGGIGLILIAPLSHSKIFAIIGFSIFIWGVLSKIGLEKILGSSRTSSAYLFILSLPLMGGLQNEDNDISRVKRQNVSGIIQVTELKDIPLCKNARAIIGKYSPWLLPKEEENSKGNDQFKNALINTISQLDNDSDELLSSINNLLTRMQAYDLTEDDIKEVMNAINSHFTSKNKQLRAVYVNKRLKVFKVNKVEQREGKSIYYLTTEDKESVTEKLPLSAISIDSKEIYIFEDVVEDKAKSWYKELKREIKGLSKEERKILKLLILKFSDENIKEFIINEEIVRQIREIGNVRAKDKTEEERIIALILMSENALRRLAFAKFLMTGVIEDEGYLKWVCEKLRIEYGGKKTIYKSVKQRIKDSYTITVNFDIKFNPAEVTDNSLLLFKHPIDYYVERLEGAYKDEKLKDISTALDELDKLLEWVCESHNPLRILVKIVADKELGNKIKNKAKEEIKNKAKEVIQNIAEREEYYDLVLPILASIGYASKGKNDSSFLSGLINSVSNNKLDTKDKSRKEKKEIRNRAERLLNTCLSIAIDEKIDISVRITALIKIKEIYTQFRELNSATHIIKLVPLLKDKNQELRNEVSSIVENWANNNKVSLDDIKVEDKQVNKQVIINSTNQEKLDDSQITAIIERITTTSMPKENQGFFGNLGEEDIKEIEGVINEKKYEEIDEFKGGVSHIAGMPVKFFVLTSQPANAPPVFIYERVVDGILEVYFSKEVWERFNELFSASEKSIALQAIALHGKVECETGSHQKAVEAHKEFLKAYPEIIEKLENLNQALYIPYKEICGNSMKMREIKITDIKYGSNKVVLNNNDILNILFIINRLDGKDIPPITVVVYGKIDIRGQPDVEGENCLVEALRKLGQEDIANLLNNLFSEDKEYIVTSDKIIPVFNLQHALDILRGFYQEEGKDIDIYHRDGIYYVSLPDVKGAIKIESSAKLSDGRIVWHAEAISEEEFSKLKLGDNDKKVIKEVGREGDLVGGRFIDFIKRVKEILFAPEVMPHYVVDLKFIQQWERGGTTAYNNNVRVIYMTREEMKKLEKKIYGTNHENLIMGGMVPPNARAAKYLLNLLGKQIKIDDFDKVIFLFDSKYLDHEKRHIGAKIIFDYYPQLRKRGKEIIKRVKGNPSLNQRLFNAIRDIEKYPYKFFLSDLCNRNNPEAASFHHHIPCSLQWI